MRTVITATAFMAVVAMSLSAANAGGIERLRLNYGTLFEAGRYIEFGAASVNPSVSGVYTNPAFGPFAGSGTGKMSPSFQTFSFAYKQDINEKLAFAIFVNTPYGADATYGQGPYSGLSATWRSQQIAGLLKYKITPAVSAYGGLRYERSRANIDIPDAVIRGGIAQEALAGSQAAAAVLRGSPDGSLNYTAGGDYDGRVGYIIGAAYEKPEIALRVALTYESNIIHKFATTETIGSPALAPLFAVLGTSTTRVEMPQSLTLDAQSGIAKDTILFGSLRWAQWSKWQVTPQAFNAIFQTPITEFKDNVLTWQLGIGHKLTEEFSVFARLGYEKSEGHEMSRLSPTDGFKSIGIGGTYTKDRMKVTAGLEYADLGDTFDDSGTRFNGNHAVGLGMTVGYRF